MTTAQASEVTTTPKRQGITLHTLMVLSIVFGLLVSGYLSYVKLTDVPMACVQGGAFDCGKVQNSAYSEMLGIPIAWLGFGTYIVLGALVILRNRIVFLQEQGDLLIFGVALFAFVYSMWLVYVQVVLLEALCVWCLLHEINMTVFLLFASVRLYRHLSAEA